MEKKTTPGKWTLFLTMGTIALGLLAPVSPEIIRLILFVFIFVLYAGCFISIISIASVYNSRAQSLSGIVFLFIDTILLFTAAYFFTSVIDSNNLMIKGVADVCLKADCYTGLTNQIENLLQALEDSLYLSVLTMNTSGDASIGVLNEGWSRWLVIFQLCATMYIVVIGFGTYISNQSKKELLAMEARIIEKFSVMNATQVKKNNDDEKKPIWQKVISYISQL